MEKEKPRSAVGTVALTSIAWEMSHDFLRDTLIARRYFWFSAKGKKAQMREKIVERSRF